MVELMQSTAPVDWPKIAVGTGIATLSAYACIHLFLALIERIGFLPFIVYRILLGAFLLIMIGI